MRRGSVRSLAPIIPVPSTIDILTLIFAHLHLFNLLGLHCACSPPIIMEEEKHTPGDSSPETNDHIESVENGGARKFDDPSYVDHRAEDDRDDVALGRNSDKFEKRYWLSVNYIGTLFAIGMAFMGGIGGKQWQVLRGRRCQYGHPCARTDFRLRLRSHCTCPYGDQCGDRPICKHQLGPAGESLRRCSLLPHGRPALRHLR